MSVPSPAPDDPAPGAVEPPPWLLAIDPGAKRVGVASSGPLGIATPVGTLEAEPRDRLLREIGRLAAERDCTTIVVGLPLNMDGTEGPAARGSRELGAAITEATGLNVVYHDERLTSIDAGQRLAGLDLTRAKKKQRLDAVAAAAILEGYLYAHSRGRA